MLASTNAQIFSSPISRKISQPTITNIFKDKVGVLWIGTQHGLYRFDGANVSTFSSNQSKDNWIPVSDISGIVQDTEGHIIIATFGGGLMILNAQSKSFEKIAENSSNSFQYVTQLANLNDGQIWGVAKDGLFFYNPKSNHDSGSLMKFDLPDDLKEISSLTSDSIGNKYFSSGMDIYKISNDTESLVKIFSGAGAFQYGKIKALCVAENGYLYAGTDRGQVFSVDLEEKSLLAKIQLLTNNAISVITLLYDNNGLWIGTNFGLFRANKMLSNVDTYNQNNSALPNSHVLALLKDDAFIWIGTYQGLSTLSFVPFETFNFENSAVFDDVLAFEEDSLGRIYVGTFNGLYVFDSRTNTHIRHEDLFSGPITKDQRVMTLATRGDEVWVGYQKNGVKILNTKTMSVSTPNFPEANKLEVTKILHTGSDRTWVATFNEGLYSFDNGVATAYLKNGLLEEPSIIVLVELKNGNVLASSENRVYEYKESNNRFNSLPFKFSNTLEQPMILCISQSADGNIWIGTKDHGVFVWSAQRQVSRNLELEKFDRDAKFDLSTIYAIQFDDIGNAWFSTQSGIVKLELSSDKISRFNKVNGLQGNDFNFGASYKDSFDRIYFGGSNGYNRFSPSDVQDSVRIPSLLITKIVFSDGKDLDYQRSFNLKHIQLDYSDYFIQLEFSVLDFLDPERNQYRYMLEGFDKQWIENGTKNSATYTNLPPGEYVFRVQGANSSGVWNRDGISLGVDVLPPLWRTWWAYTFYVLATIFMCWVGKRAYDARAIERRAREMAIMWHESEERADDEMQEQLEIHDDLVKSLYRHSVSTLNLVSEFISIKSADLNDIDAREAADSSIRLVEALSSLEDCLYYQNEKLLADLNKYTDIIVSRLLAFSPVPRETISTINEVTSRTFPIEQASFLAIALYELLENAIQHAFDSHASANYIHVVLAKETSDGSATRYTLTVRDNGVGIPSIIDLRGIQTPGLFLVNAMVRKLAGSMEISTEGGTRMAIHFPGEE